MSEHKEYTPREERLNAFSHWAGVVLFLAGIIPVLKTSAVRRDPLALAGGIFYCFTLLMMFGCSAVYHTVRSAELKKLTRKLDHCAIYFLITGSYAPVLYVSSRDLTGGIIFGVLLGLSILGTVGKFLAGHRFHKIEVGLYIIMGWCAVFIAGKVIRQLPPSSLWLLLGGGIAYTSGVAAYLSRREFSHAVWHIFVLAGAILQFFAITAALNL